MSYLDVYGLGMVITDSAVGAGFTLGALGTVGAIGALGASALGGADASVTGQDFTNANGQPGFTNISSFDNSIVNGATTNTSPAGAQFSQQQIYNNVYQNAIANGVSPTNAAQYAQYAANNGVDFTGGTSLGAQVTGETNAALAQAAGGTGAATGAGTAAATTGAATGAATGTAAGAGVTSLAPVTTTATSLAGGGSTLGTIGTVGAGAGAGLAAGSLAGMGASPSGASQYAAQPNTSTSSLSNGTVGGTAAGAATGAAGSAAGGAAGAAGSAGSSLLGSLGANPGTVGAVGSLLAGGGSLAAGLSGGTSTSAPNPGTVAGDILQDEINFAPQVYNTTAQYAPQYNALQNQLQSTSAGSLTGTYAALAPVLQGTQTAINAQQAAGQQALLANQGASTVAAYQAANPQLQQLQQQYTNLAMSNPNPVSQIQAPTNQTLDQLNSTAQSQLALGTSVSPQEASTVANEVLSNYNQMGRANDPTAIANLALGEDTYGQQLLTQREQNAGTAAGLTTNQGALSLYAGQANQQAQLANANYQQSTLQGASNLAYQTAAPAMAGLYGQSAALNSAQNVGSQANSTVSGGNSLSGLYNPFDSAAYNSAYSANANANATNAATNASLIGGGLSLLGGLNTAAGNAGGYANLFS
jgi:hypothetical protein